MMTKRIYLAGPEVFLANARDIGARKRAICERHGLVGVFPGDEEDPCDPALSPAEQGLAISRAMERVMQGCDAMIVNLTRSADQALMSDQPTRWDSCVRSVGRFSPTRMMAAPSSIGSPSSAAAPCAYA